MLATVRKWGNSAAVRIPAPVMEQAKIRLDQPVEISAEEGVIMIRSARLRYTLEELMAKVTPENIHPETDWGPDVGREVLPIDTDW